MSANTALAPSSAGAAPHASQAPWKQRRGPCRGAEVSDSAAPRLQELLQQAGELAAQQAHVARLQKGGVLISRQQPQIASEEGGANLLEKVVAWRQRWYDTVHAMRLSEGQKVRCTDLVWCVITHRQTQSKRAHGLPSTPPQSLHHCQCTNRPAAVCQWVQCVLCPRVG